MSSEWTTRRHNRMGGTKSQTLSQTACDLWHWCLQRGITLSAVHLPGVLNSIADEESRTLHSSAEWMLDRSICRGVIQILGPCSVDLFATRLNNQQRKYISWRPNSSVVTTDAFTMSWQEEVGYAFPHILRDRQMPAESSTGGVYNDSGDPCVGRPALVPGPTGPLNRIPPAIAVTRSTFSGPLQQGTPISATRSAPVAAWTTLHMNCHHNTPLHFRCLGICNSSIHLQTEHVECLFFACLCMEMVPSFSVAGISAGAPSFYIDHRQMHNGHVQM